MKIIRQSGTFQFPEGPFSRNAQSIANNMYEQIIINEIFTD